MFGKKRQAATGEQAHDVATHCALCGQDVAVGPDGRCELGHRVWSPAASPVPETTAESDEPAAEPAAPAPSDYDLDFADALGPFEDGPGAAETEGETAAAAIADDAESSPAAPAAVATGTGAETEETPADHETLGTDDAAQLADLDELDLDFGTDDESR